MNYMPAPIWEAFVILRLSAREEFLYRKKLNYSTTIVIASLALKAALRYERSV